MNKIKALFFDLGNVIINFDLKFLEEGFKPYGYVSDGSLGEYIMSPGPGTKYMEGKISPSDFYNKTRRSFKMNIKFEEFWKVWNSIFYPCPEMETVIKTIKERYPAVLLLLLSDTNESHFNFLKKTYPVLGLMDHYVLSHEIGVLKPHPRFYTEAINLSGTVPKNIFYTDDRPELIKAARTMGIRAYQFEGHEMLRAQLGKLGIEV